MLHSHSESIVVLIDLQTRLMPAIHDGASVVAQALRLGRIARGLDVPVIGTEQNPGALGENAQEIKDLCSTTVAKQHFDATADGLLEALPEGRTRVIVAGAGRGTIICKMRRQRARQASSTVRDTPRTSRE
ncbi:isochorismatase family protein [Paraburkholderia sp. BR10937]|uniref:isochorismatase family protein n=1 Tax=Paraburkholderia sp. BR10937 TaxID=3236994 RepID=UPI0034D1C0E3